MTLLSLLMTFVAWREKRISFAQFMVGSPAPLMVIAAALSPLGMLILGKAQLHELPAFYLAAAQGLAICFAIGLVTLSMVLGLSWLAQKHKAG